MKTLLFGLFLALIGLSGAKAETALLLKTVSITSDSGIASFPAGKTYEVIQIGGDGCILKTADGRTFVAPKTDVTTDAAVIEKAMAAATPAPVQVVRNPTPAPPVATPSVAPTPSKEEVRAEKRAKIAALQAKLVELRAEIKKHGGDSSPENRARMSEIEKIHSQLDVIRSS